MKIILLNKKASAVIRPNAPFNFDGTVYVPQHFPTPDFEWKSGVLWQSMNFNMIIYGLKMENRGTTAKPKIKLTVYSNKEVSKEELLAIKNELNWRYGFGEDLAEFFGKFKNDKFLKPVFAKLRGMRSSCINSLYELLMISIVLQNATVRRTVQMMNNLLGKYGKVVRFDGKELAVYWNPSDLNGATEPELRTLKVGYRDKMIKLISKSFSENEINEFELRKMSTEDAKKWITKLFGVGPATAQIILAEYLRRHDIFELKGRVWEQKILSRILFNKKLVPAERIIEEFEKRYGNWKGLSYYYIFTNLFWKHKEKNIEWLEKEIRL
ncbi:MAG TPA: hypothetical protein HA230_00470 [Candidatus Aenigmarchaeota archaeon]|nr:hypothetical protein [Candidatus Aenigmarchaeota archaeon]